MTSEEAEELRATEEASRKLEEFLKGLEEKKEDLQVLSLRLEDATEGMNDALRDVEKALCDRKVRPGWTRIPLPDEEDHALVWDGKHLLYDDGRQRTALLSSSRKRRTSACGRLEALAKELARKR